MENDEIASVRRSQSDQLAERFGKICCLRVCISLTCKEMHIELGFQASWPLGEGLMNVIDLTPTSENASHLVPPWLSARLIWAVSELQLRSILKSSRTRFTDRARP
jgi:hypothetical protein